MPDPVTRRDSGVRRTPALREALRRVRQPVQADSRTVHSLHGHRGCGSQPRAANRARRLWCGGVLVARATALGNIARSRHPPAQTAVRRGRLVHASAWHPAQPFFWCAPGRPRRARDGATPVGKLAGVGAHRPSRCQHPAGRWRIATRTLRSAQRRGAAAVPFVAKARAAGQPAAGMKCRRHGGGRPTGCLRSGGGRQRGSEAAARAACEAKRRLVSSPASQQAGRASAPQLRAGYAVPSRGGPRASCAQHSGSHTAPMRWLQMLGGGPIPRRGSAGGGRISRSFRHSRSSRRSRRVRQLRDPARPPLPARRALGALREAQSPTCSVKKPRCPQRCARAANVACK